MKKKPTFYQSLKHRFRLVLFDSSYEEVGSIYTTRLESFLFLLFLFLFVSFLTILTLSFTPLREYIPGYSPPHLSKDLIKLSLQTDSLLEDIKIKEQKYMVLKKILLGESLNDSIFKQNKINISVAPSDLKASIEDSIYREKVEREGRFNIFSEHYEKPFELMKIAFYAPLKGVLSDSFDVKKKHFGVDVVAPENEAIKSTLPGTVIIANWTIETGYTILIQHENEIISSYKHNSVLLKRVGEKVRAGDVIAIIGNSGALSTGPHLHFELWHKGIPINPEHHILF